MAEQLGRVAFKLTTENKGSLMVAQVNRRRRSKVEDKLRTLKEKIQNIPLAVLEDAENQQLKDGAVKNWLDDIKAVFYDVIDFRERLIIEEKKLQEERKVSYSGQPLFRLNPFRSQCMQEVGNDVVQLEEIDRVVNEIKGINNRREVVNVSQSSRLAKQWQEKPPTLSFDHEESKIYGRDEQMRRMVPRLYHRKEKVQFICILGEAGIGKTAIAQKVFDNLELQSNVKDGFDLKAWVDVSEEFSAFRIAQDFMESVTSKKINMVEQEILIQRARQAIKEKRFLLVLDGVQDEDKSKWKTLIEIFNCGGPGSTIFITTRYTAVPQTVGSAHTVSLGPLPDEHCWSIIKHQAFGPTSSNGLDIKMIYDEVGKSLLEKCKGLPIIAKSVGSVLRGRTGIKDWKEVLKSDIWDSVPANQPRAMISIMFIYYFLPSKLRQCLLYCSIFPKNHYIDENKLIKLWMAQDFIALDQDALDKDDMEKDARGCFEKLLDRSVFKDYKQDDSGNFICKLEGTMTDFLQLLAENECHIMLLDKTEQQGAKEVPAKVRHCTLNVALQASLPASIGDTKQLHTLMILSAYSSIDLANLTSLLNHMRMLKALELSFCSMKELPKKVVELLHLRYLDLSFNRDLKKLPKEICNLFNLQTLNLNGCDDLQKLPKGMGKLTKLRHLEILWTPKLSYLPKGVASLTSLRTLSRFFGSSGDDSGACNLEDLKNLNNLQGYISIDGLGGQAGVSQAEKANLKEKKKLHGLELWFSVVESESGDEDLLKALEAPSELQCLAIFNYRGKDFPIWITALENLKHLVLADCTKCVYLPPLGLLPSLESLEIRNATHVKEVGSEFLGIKSDIADGSKEVKGAFPKLKNLSFQMLDSWEMWTEIGVHATIMPLLSSLSIVSCQKLNKELPRYIKEREKSLRIERK